MRVSWYKADLLADHLNSKQSSEAVDLHSLAIRMLVLSHMNSSRVRSGLLFYSIPYGGTDPLGMFPLVPSVSV